MRDTTMRRLRARTVFAPSGCWEWTGHLCRGDYGVIHSGGKNRLAHRISYEFFVGPIPEGLTIDHLCRNRRCLNPDHLEAVTMRENLLRGESPYAINARKTHCVAGHELSDANVLIADDGRRRCLECKRRRGRISAQRWRDKRAVAR